MANASARASNARGTAVQPSRSAKAPLERVLSESQRQEPAEQRHSDRAEALWAEMQSTLEDVELSATNDTHVFGPEHTKALADLRGAQIALAEAWARSEMEGSEKSTEPGPSLAKATASETGRRNSAPDEANTTKADDEPEDDIASAKRRREENDRFFEKINHGVEGVMSRLEEVATAMRAVERESREIWSDSATSSRSTSIS